jgi:hypothetical protein
MLLVTVDAVLRPSLGDGGRKLLEDLLGVFPVDACIGDRDTILET